MFITTEPGFKPKPNFLALVYTPLGVKLFINSRLPWAEWHLDSNNENTLGLCVSIVEI